MDSFYLHVQSSPSPRCSIIQFSYLWLGQYKFEEKERSIITTDGGNDD
jgi:hypothetical protein